MRFHRALTWLAAAALATLGLACSGDIAEEKARLAAEKAQETIRPLDAGAMAQDIDADTVKQVQEQLTTLKEYMGPITGRLDQVTLNALEAFQRTHDITADGRFNEETLEALATAARKRGQDASRGPSAGSHQREGSLPRIARTV